jgi:hypothetical protein
MSAKVKEIKFDDLPDQLPKRATAASVLDNTTGQLTFIVNPKYQAENPFLFSVVLAHEPLHSDDQVADYEEVIALALHSFVYLQQLARHPELGQLETELARRSHSNAFARLNAGEGHRLGNVTNDDMPLLPGSPLSFTSWLEQFEQLQNFVPTPGNRLLAKYVRRLQERQQPPCSAEEFNEALLACVLENQRGLTPKQLLAAANALELETQLSLAAHEVDSEEASR